MRLPEVKEDLSVQRQSKAKGLNSVTNRDSKPKQAGRLAPFQDSDNLFDANTAREGNPSPAMRAFDNNFGSIFSEINQQGFDRNPAPRQRSKFASRGRIEDVPMNVTPDDVQDMYQLQQLEIGTSPQIRQMHKETSLPLLNVARSKVSNIISTKLPEGRQQLWRHKQKHSMI
eukprot:TRINITY_DN10948_c0_g1_i2.p1 TRINITY_DN10948_c0_g1~~TRINITY_DN10948_c0_g1_i2.p1  ORF type:complete len:172 (+),score=29.69 TRINITY_DN10948_c0_g1_i2:128-643(+)